MGSSATDSKIRMLGSGGKYDVCQSSNCGSGPRPERGPIGASSSFGVCKSATPDGRTVCLLKTLLTNKCVHDCKYCENAVPGPRAEFEPQELAKLFMGLYLQNRVEGLFLSSGVCGDADRTAERMIEAVSLVRNKYQFGGYVHLKVLPGMSYEYVKQMSELADRMSINIEAPSHQQLSEIAPNKDMNNDIIKRQDAIREFDSKGHLSAGQTTQLIVGAADETDSDILKMMDWQYKNQNLKRIYFSAFGPCPNTPFSSKKATPLSREHRLYQTDWLLRVYKMPVREITGALGEDGNLPNADPKTVLAVNNGLKPVDVNTAQYKELLRVPGIGPQSASRILALRRAQKRITSYKELHNIGVVLKRASPFIKVNGWTQARLIA